ncbi:MAG: thioredoxin-dependent thiol peroxidase [Rhodobiaceae bacterium]|jgi:peroxiredoxin Q/BCP|nr:thioredoxin-dependent thiol peroxidase [Rhodobiaceae bacterium]MBT5517778.1 thioredoxin-dependent thiol peroxidase [Rhodobiaceae bacterium]
MTGSLKIGDRAPDFSLPASGDQTLSLADFKGRKLVLYFYPKDNTPGCTTQAIDFTAAAKAFEAANTAVVGVSADSLKKHDNFITKHQLAIPLISDEDHVALNAYGVWVEKSMYGKKFMGIERATYLISEDGNIAAIWRKVKVKGHIEAVLEAVGG